MLNKSIVTAIITAFGLLLTPVVYAHTLMPEQISWVAGVSHPISGVDHLLAMLAVGLWAAQQGGHRLWQLPCAFLGMMLLGATHSYLGWSLLYVESGIASSLLVLGLLLAFAIRLSILPSMLLVSLFALFHGYAHGIETPQTAAVFAYASGFMFASAVLHGLGIASGLLAKEFINEKTLRMGGIAIGITGAWLWI
jgi:urease accessory protein